MNGEVIGALLVFAGLLLTQALLHGRWTREQDDKREELANRLAAERKADAERQARERRQEQSDFFDRMAEQTNSVVENAVKLAEVHQGDAEKARLLALETAAAHAECRQEVAHLAGKVEELRARVIETERTSGQEQANTQWHRDRAHAYLTALTVSEGYAASVQSLVLKCKCKAFDPISTLTETFRPRLEGFLDEAKRWAAANPP